MENKKNNNSISSKQARSRMSPSFIFFNSIFLSYSNYTFFNSIFQEFFFYFFIFLWINTEELFDGDFAIQKRRKTSLQQKELCVCFFFISLAFLFMSFQLNLIGGKWNRTMQTPYHILIQAYTLECVCFIRFKIGGLFFNSIIP